MSKLSSTNIPKISVKISCFTNAVSFIFFIYSFLNKCTFSLLVYFFNIT